MEPTSPHSSLTIGDEAVQYLTTTRKWALFVAVMGFVGAGLMILIGAIMGLLGSSLMPETGDANPFVGLLLGFLYVGVGILYAVPSFFLLRFSTHMKEAILARTEGSLTESFRYLRSYFAFNGIALIVAVAIVFLAILAGIGLAILAATSGVG